MLALQLEPIERRQAEIFDGRQPAFRLTRKTWLALGCVAVFYAGLGALVVTQKVRLAAVNGPDPKPIVLETYKTEKAKPPPTARVEKQVPPLHAPTPQPVIVEQPQPLPITPVEEPVAPPAIPVANLDPVRPLPMPATEPAPTAKPDPIIGKPEWISKPTPQQLGRAYPRRAAALGVNGAATLLCSVTASGTMSNCEVTAESPKGYRFGQAALDSARYFRISPKTVDGRPVEGAKVRIPMIFNLE